MNFKRRVIGIKKVAIIGANEYQARLIQKAVSLGYETHVFAWEQGAVGKDFAHFFYPISILDKELILEQLKLIKPDAVCSVASDLAVPTVNFIADQLGLISNPFCKTEQTVNKYKMKSILDHHRLPTTKYRLIKKEEVYDLSDFHFPLIVKPVDRSGSRGVTAVYDNSELSVAVHAAFHVSFVQEVIVEEFAPGDEFSVEFISQHGEHHFLQITQKYTTQFPHFIEKAHFSPARLNKETREKIKGIVKASLNALEIETGASHSEIKMDREGNLNIIEIGARMGGDFIGSDMVFYTTGYDYLKAVLDCALGNKIIIPTDLNLNKTLVYFLFDESDYVKYQIIRKKYSECLVDAVLHEGDLASPEDSSTRNGYFILRMDRQEELEAIFNILNLN